MATTKKSTSTHPKANSDDVTRVYELLVEYDGRSLQKHFICELLGIRDERIVRDAVSQLVLRGLAAAVPDRQNGGYRITRDPELIKAEIVHLTAHKKKVNERIGALRKIARSLDADVIEVAA